VMKDLDHPGSDSVFQGAAQMFPGGTSLSCMARFAR